MLKKEQLSTLLEIDTVNRLNNLVSIINNEYNIKVNRSQIIEFAVEKMLEVYPDAIKDFDGNTKTIKKDNLDYDTIICPAKANGLDNFLKEKKWQYIRLNQDKIDKIKYIALYVGNPISKITHYAKVKTITEVIHQSKKKYIIMVENPIELENHVILGDSNPISTRAIKYTTLDKLFKARKYSDLNN